MPPRPQRCRRNAAGPERCRGGKVVDALRHDAREIDGVDGGELRARGEGRIGEQCLHDILRVVEAALKRDIVDVRIGHGGHLAPLHV